MKIGVSIVDFLCHFICFHSIAGIKYTTKFPNFKYTIYSIVENILYVLKFFQNRTVEVFIYN